MTEYVESDVSMKRYLLGELVESEQQALEGRLMASDDYFEQLLIAEDDLVDEYLRGTLSAREKQRFNDHFLCTPERRHKLSFSRSLQKYVAAYAESRRTVWRWPGLLTLQGLPHRILEWSLAGTLSLIVLGGSWLTFRIQRLEQLLEQASQQAAAGGQPQEAMMAFPLTPGLVRGMQGMQKVALPAGADWVQLQLDLGTGEYNRYQAVLQNVEGEQIWSQNTPKVKVGRDSELVVLTLPAGLLPRGYYILKLSGMGAGGAFEEVARYSFSVVQK
jgi:hypothetical protein